jgi:hypothetical protein
MANEPLNEVAYKFYTQEVTAGAGVTDTQLRASPVPVVTGALPAGATQLTNSNGNAANAQAQATFAAVSGKTNYITGMTVCGGGSTAGLATFVTLAGVSGGSLFYPIVAPIGALVGFAPLTVVFNPPLAASAANTAITATLPALGAGGLAAGVSITGYRV